MFPSPTAFKRFANRSLRSTSVFWMRQCLYLTQAGSLARFWDTRPHPPLGLMPMSGLRGPRGNSRRRAIIEPVHKADGLGDVLHLRHSIVTARETQTVTLAIIKP